MIILQRAGLLIAIRSTTLTKRKVTIQSQSCVFISPPSSSSFLQPLPFHGQLHTTQTTLAYAAMLRLVPRRRRRQAQALPSHPALRMMEHGVRKLQTRNHSMGNLKEVGHKRIVHLPTSGANVTPKKGTRRSHRRQVRRTQGLRVGQVHRHRRAPRGPMVLEYSILKQVHRQHRPHPLNNIKCEISPHFSGPGASL